ncbi:LTA synthase family protein [Paenibacillus sacheonensis]|uniref:Sulfatase-like hydrolase/transferase n=1 Tax=Paenibacillus sacheonensis TaxID=742054 RepID=A0A7X4YQG1_9BACL|nr:LTA synthase family protein [Paenibacillus sacheonensis]MBM7565373.1 phosphoglycerol transferase MdoB-like AlkP superfamily enzyme [Paenibacillus sacheonensis]NBC69699.1 sulfatase-like hydrolase/transferase [Paenibacillus sacheonensis]
MPAWSFKRLIHMKPFIFFTLILILKGMLAYFVIFDGGPSWTLLVTEIPFCWLLFCLIEWFATKRKLVYYVTVNLLVTAIFFAVIMYYKYFGIIVTYHALEQVNQVTAVKSSVFSLLDPYYLFIFLDIIVFFVLLFRRKRALDWKRMSQLPLNRAIVSAVFIVSLALCLFNILPNRASMNEIVKAEDMGILNYELYTLFSDPKQPTLPMSEITQAAIDREKGIEEPASPKYWQASKGKNLIIVQMEAFQNFLVGLTIDGQEITPNMNKLAKAHIYFSNFYQQVGQGNTSDAEFVVNTSFYTPPTGAASVVYTDRALPSLPKLLQANGYQTATFHTNFVEFWNRSELYKAIGFEKYYDQNWFGKDDTVFFGPSDEVLYQKTAEQLGEMQKSGPFYSQLITMSSHHPFTIPERKYKIKLPARYDGTFVGDYIRAQNYADYALGLFIDDLKKRGIWDNSVFVIYGDHLGLPIYSLNNDEKKLMKEIYGRDYANTDMINIPLIISAPGVTKPMELKETGGQSDIMPTVANLLGISLQDHIHFGQDLLNQSSNILPERYYLPTGSLLTDHDMFIPGTSFKDGTNHPLHGDAQAAVPTTEDQYNRALKLLQMSDSYVSQLPSVNP